MLNQAVRDCQYITPLNPRRLGASESITDAITIVVCNHQCKSAYDVIRYQVTKLQNLSSRDLVDLVARGQPMMTVEQERWAEALAVMKEHGEGTNAFLAERVATLARSGNLAGVRRWWEIAQCCDRLRNGTMQ